MTVFKVIGIALTAVAAALVLRAYRPELGLQIAVAAGVLILVLTLDELAAMSGFLREVLGRYQIDTAYLTVMLKVIGVAYLAYIIHVAVVYGSSIKFLSGMNPIAFFKGLAPAMICAFTTTSSNATLPLNIECCNNMGAEPEISSFVLPLGATINMDGTAIYQAVATIFIAACYNIDLTLADMAMVVLTATLASVGTAGVSGAGMIMLAMVLTSIGIPVEGIAIIAGVDKLFDMGRTTLNITGDATCAIWISKLERAKKARMEARANAKA